MDVTQINKVTVKHPSNVDALQLLNYVLNLVQSDERSLVKSICVKPLHIEHSHYDLLLCLFEVIVNGKKYNFVRRFLPQNEPTLEKMLSSIEQEFKGLLTLDQDIF